LDADCGCGEAGDRDAAFQIGKESFGVVGVIAAGVVASQHAHSARDTTFMIDFDGVFIVCYLDQSVCAFDRADADAFIASDAFLQVV
jgi:hypothetical protein